MSSRDCGCTMEHCGMRYDDYTEAMEGTGSHGELYTKLVDATCTDRPFPFSSEPLSLNSRSRPTKISDAFPSLPFLLESSGPTSHRFQVLGISQKTIRKRPGAADYVYFCPMRIERRCQRMHLTVEILRSGFRAGRLESSEELQWRLAETIFEKRFVVEIKHPMATVVPVGGQLLVDEMTSDFYAVFYRCQADCCLITIVNINLIEKAECELRHYAINGDFNFRLLQFKFDRTGEQFIATKILMNDTTAGQRFASVKFTIPVKPSPGHDVICPVSGIMNIPSEDLSDLIGPDKPIMDPSQLQIRAIDIWRRSGRYDWFYLGKIRSWRIYRNWLLRPEDGLHGKLKSVLAVTRNRRAPQAVSLMSDFFDDNIAPGSPSTNFDMLPSGRLIFGLLILTDDDLLMKQFQMLADYPEEMMKKCANCKKTEAVLQVCRICKKNDRHLQWWKNPCHFCSGQCFKAGWNQHKKQCH